jgi:hypothetical protein
LTLTVIVVASVGLGVALIKGRALDTESNAFVDAAIPAISATWSKQQLLDRATPELRDIAKPDELMHCSTGSLSLALWSSMRVRPGSPECPI